MCSGVSCVMCHVSCVACITQLHLLSIATERLMLNAKRLTHQRSDTPSKLLSSSDRCCRIVCALKLQTDSQTNYRRQINAPAYSTTRKRLSQAGRCAKAQNFCTNVLLDASQVCFQRLRRPHQRGSAHVQPLVPCNADDDVAEHNYVPLLLPLVRCPRWRSLRRRQ
jgi:hypothetical protein